MRMLWRGALVAISSFLGLVLVLRIASDPKVDRRDEQEEGRPGFDEPDQFARILMQMRIPSDRQEPEYTAGYQVRELERARATQKVTGAPPGPGDLRFTPYTMNERSD